MTSTAPPDHEEVVEPAEPPAAPAHRHADFSRAVLADLYRYPRKKNGTAFTIWALTGFLGGHRFHLDRPATGLIMLFTGGGGLIWWIVDAFFIKKFVLAFNEDQAQRQSDGRPPKALDFMPPLRGATLPLTPTWIAKRGGRKRVLGDVLVLFLAGLVVGRLASVTSNFEAVLTICALSAITLLGARWDSMVHIPVLRELDRWSHRLRLFYYFNDPGGPLVLFFRPLFGLISAPFRKKARAEAWLYLQLGAWFTILFTGLDALQVTGIATADFGFHGLNLLGDMALTFVSIYAFAAPIGAILTTHVLLEKSDYVVWGLTAVAIVGMLFGIAID